MGLLVGIVLGQKLSKQNQCQMALVASSPSSAFHMTAKPDSSRKKKRRRRKRGKVVEDRRAEFVTRWRPETTFGYRSFEPGEGRVQVVSLDLQPQRTGEDKGDEKKERIKSSKHKRQLYQHSNSPQTLSPPRPWTPRPASVSFLLVEEQQQRQQATALVSRLISEVVSEMMDEEMSLHDT